MKKNDQIIITDSKVVYIKGFATVQCECNIMSIKCMYYTYKFLIIPN